MKTTTISEFKKELKNCSKTELMDLCMHLAKYKKENKELLTYLIYDASNEAGYIDAVKAEIDLQFTQINTASYFYIKKTVRKILRMTKKYIRYSKKKATEAELLLYFCKVLKSMKPTIYENTVLTNIFNRQIELIEKAIAKLHEDLQFDYVRELENLS
jgi:vacuolar-type H+-ATPase catalytic subunit A/Vma1